MEPVTAATGNSMLPEPRSLGVAAAASGPAVAFLGTMVPDEPVQHGPAFNRAGQMFQAELVGAMARAGLSPLQIYSVEPMAAFPRSRRLWRGSGTKRVGRFVARMLPFVNVQPLKVLTAGVSTYLALLRWAWKHRKQPRVMLVVNLTMPPGIFVWFAARSTGSRAVVSVLDVWKPGGIVPDSWARRLDFSLQRWLLPKFDGHMVVSRAIADDLVPNRTVCILEGGVAQGRFGRVPSARPVDVRFRVVLAGTLESFNGVDLLIAAMPLLPLNCQVVIAGAGPLAKDVQALAERDPRVEYLGFVSFEQLLELYASADLLLNARITKALDTRYFFPSKLMELLASGTPVLSTCTGHVENEYGSVLYLLAEETPRALASRIEAIMALDPDERRAVGIRAREFMLREKTWDRQGERLAEYIRHEVLGPRSGR